MSLSERLKKAASWAFNGSEEHIKSREERKEQNSEIKKVEQEAYLKAKKELAKKVAVEKAKFEAEKEIQSIKDGGFVGKLVKAVDNVSKNISDNSKKGGKKSKVKEFKPIDFSKVKLEF